MFNFFKNRKRIKEQLKSLKADKKALYDYEKNKYIKDNEGIIDIYVNNEQLFAPYCNPKDPIIHSDIYDYMDQEIKRIPVGYPINVNIYLNDDINLEIDKKIYQHYWEELAMVKSRLRKTRFISILLFSLGIIFYMIYFTFIYLIEHKLIFKEIISITATFLIWESVDYFLLQGLETQINYLQISRLALAKFNIVIGKEDI